MTFDADAYLEALGPPSITLGGKTYVGRFLSIEEWLPFEKRIREVMDVVESPKPDSDQYTLIVKLMRDYCIRVFPPTWRQVFSFSHRSVGEQVIALPPAALLQAARSFFECQARALTVWKNNNEENQ